MGNEPFSISESEREVLKVLWECGAATVRQIRELLARRDKHWAHTTVNTLLGRLQQKGCVTCDSSGFAHVFAPAMSRDEFMRKRLDTLAENYFDGTRVPLMLALVDGQTFSAEEIQQFRQLLDGLQSESSSRPKKQTPKNKRQPARKAAQNKRKK